MRLKWKRPAPVGLLEPAVRLNLETRSRARPGLLAASRYFFAATMISSDLRHKRLAKSLSVRDGYKRTAQCAMPQTSETKFLPA